MKVLFVVAYTHPFYISLSDVSFIEYNNKARNVCTKRRGNGLSYYFSYELREMILGKNALLGSEKVQMHTP